MCLWAIYIFSRSVHIFPAVEYADRSWEYTVQIAHRHMHVEIGPVAAQSFSGNFCFQFSVLVICSVAGFPYKLCARQFAAGNGHYRKVAVAARSSRDDVSLKLNNSMSQLADFRTDFLTLSGPNSPWVWLVTSRLETGKLLTFFYSVSVYNWHYRNITSGCSCEY